MLFCATPPSLRTRTNSFRWRGSFAFALGLGKGRGIHLEVASTGTQISHNPNAGRRTICRLKTSDVCCKKCFEIVQFVRATVYEISRETCVYGRYGQLLSVRHLFGDESTDP
jgi:hypothetical protein